MAFCHTSNFSKLNIVNASVPQPTINNQLSTKNYLPSRLLQKEEAGVMLRQDK
jgi:hypothetical protein